MPKYNIYVICKTEEDFLEKSTALMSQYKSKICHIQWIPAEYLKLTQCNRVLLKDLNTRHNTEKSKIIAKLGTIAAHRKALLAIYMNKTDNNIVLEADSTLAMTLPNPPKVSCYMGGWIIPPRITDAGSVKVNLRPKKGLNSIDYERFGILMTHALFIASFEEAMELFQTTICDKIKNYDVHLLNLQYFKQFYYPPVFVQADHVSEIDKKRNVNNERSADYGLKML